MLPIRLCLFPSWLMRHEWGIPVVEGTKPFPRVRARVRVRVGEGVGVGEGEGEGEGVGGGEYG